MESNSRNLSNLKIIVSNPQFLENNYKAAISKQGTCENKRNE